MKSLDSIAMKVSGFSEPLRVKASETKSEFPCRHDWDLFYMKNKMDESKPGERPDTVYLAKLPIKWFNDGVIEGPSSILLTKAMEKFGSVRTVDIPMCDPLRIHMNPKVTGFQTKGFRFGQDVFFEAYVQYQDYNGFLTAMESLRNMKWAKRIDGKLFLANVKVDFDRTKHLSEANTRKREEERERLLAEKRRQADEADRARTRIKVLREMEEARKRREEEDRERRREERERKRKRKRELERQQRKEKERRERVEREIEKKNKQKRLIESQRILECVFNRIQLKADRRKREEEEQLKADLRVIGLNEIATNDKEDKLRKVLLKQRELRIRERVSRKLDGLICRANPLYSIVVLVEHLVPSNVIDKIIGWLRRTLETMLTNVLRDSVNINPSEQCVLHSFFQLTSSLVSIQDKLHNLKQYVKRPDDLIECIKAFESHICPAITSSLEYAFESLMATRDINLTILSAFIAKGRNVVIHLFSSTILEYTVSWLCSKEPSPLWDRISQRLFTDDSCGSREFEAMVTNIVTVVKSGENLMRCFGYAIRRSPCIKRICQTKLLLQRICRSEIPSILADYIYLGGGKEMFVDTVKAVLTVWSDPGSIKYSSLEQQNYLTRIVLEFTRRINDIGAEDSWSILFTLVIQGVQERLGNADLAIRQSGMFVGESCSNWMQGNQLKFDYINDIWLREMKSYRSLLPMQVFESALFSLEAMIRRRAIGFNDIASKLITTLVFVDNRFNTKDFEVYV
uniref:RRM domain-containing protein n=1 Tax=Heterorhabditis bacteriophora TaxID=37862 RepID=A0A1I7X2P3_HETBA